MEKNYLDALGIKFTLMDLYVGLEKDFIDTAYIKDRFEQICGKAFCLEETENVLRKLELIVKQEYKDNFETSYSYSWRKWRFAFLFLISCNNRSDKITEKRILSFRDKSVFLSDWKSFIESYDEKGKTKLKVNSLNYLLFLHKEQKDLAAELASPAIKELIEKGKKPTIKEFQSALLEEFNFLIDIGYDAKPFSIAWEVGIHFESNEIGQKISIYGADTGVIMIHFVKSYKCFFKRNKFAWLGYPFIDLSEYGPCWMIDPKSPAYRECFKMNAQFMKEHIMPILKGNKWFDDLYKRNII